MKFTTITIRELDEDDVDRLNDMIEEIQPYASGLRCITKEAFETEDPEEKLRLLKKARREALHALDAIEDAFREFDIDGDEE